RSTTCRRRVPTAAGGRRLRRGSFPSARGSGRGGTARREPPRRADAATSPGSSRPAPLARPDRAATGGAGPEDRLELLVVALTDDDVDPLRGEPAEEASHRRQPRIVR